MKSSIIHFLLLMLMLTIGKSLHGKDLLLGNNQLESLKLAPYMSILKEGLAGENPSFYLENKELFSSSAVKDPLPSDQVYWFRTDLKTSPALKFRFYAIQFQFLTNVDLYIYKKEKLIAHKKAGAFIQLNEIDSLDSRFQFNLELDPNSEYTLLFRVHHKKEFRPILNFVLENVHYSTQLHEPKGLLNAFLFGAVMILMVYIALSWLVTRYRSYIWIFIFLLSIEFYVLTLQYEFTDLLFGNNPKLAWALGLVFLRMGTISFYFFMFEFLQLKKLSNRLYNIACLIIVIVGILMFVSFIDSYYISKYYQIGNFNYAMGLVNTAFLIVTFTLIWKKIDAAQKLLVLGILWFAIGLFVLILGVFLIQETMLAIVPAIAQITIIFICVGFLVGIRLRLKKMEEERVILLEENNRIQKIHTQEIENKVIERTSELMEANRELHLKQEELLEKNDYIGTLIDELNHRVKNNLQLLYGLSSLQPIGKDQKSNPEPAAIKEMRGRIKAMMLVNHLLTSNKGEALQLNDLFTESTTYLQQLYDPKFFVDISLELPQHCWIPAKISLPLSLIFTEIMTNTFKYAFPPNFTGQPKINIICKENEGLLTFQFTDNGVGSDHTSNGNSLGISLIKDLCRQIKGKLRISTNQGFQYNIQFPLKHGYSSTHH